METKDVHIRLDGFDDFELPCGECGVLMSHDLRRSGRRNTRGTKFIDFTAEHMTRLEGEAVEITSIADVRRLEKKYEDQKLCFEAFSFDDNYGADAPDGRSEKLPARGTPFRF